MQTTEDQAQKHAGAGGDYNDCPANRAMVASQEQTSPCGSLSPTRAGVIRSTATVLSKVLTRSRRRFRERGGSDSQGPGLPCRA